MLATMKHWRLAVALLPLLSFGSSGVMGALHFKRPGFDAGCLKYDPTAFEDNTPWLESRNNGGGGGGPKIKPMSAFHVDGKKLPGVSEAVGDIGDSWAGLLPNSKDPKNKAKYFFWL